MLEFGRRVEGKRVRQLDGSRVAEGGETNSR
jgi:hypothetical protein